MGGIPGNIKCSGGGGGFSRDAVVTILKEHVSHIWLSFGFFCLGANKLRPPLPAPSTLRCLNPAPLDTFTPPYCQSGPFPISLFFFNQVPWRWPWSQEKIHGGLSAKRPNSLFVVAKITPVHCARKCGWSILSPCIDLGIIISWEKIRESVSHPLQVDRAGAKACLGLNFLKCVYYFSISGLVGLEV